jgi:hypothetical protein
MRACATDGVERLQTGSKSCKRARVRVLPSHARAALEHVARSVPRRDEPALDEIAAR